MIDFNNIIEVEKYHRRSTTPINGYLIRVTKSGSLTWNENFQRDVMKGAKRACLYLAKGVYPWVIGLKAEGIVDNDPSSNKITKVNDKSKFYQISALGVLRQSGVVLTSSLKLEHNYAPDKKMVFFSPQETSDEEKEADLDTQVEHEFTLPRGRELKKIIQRNVPMADDKNKALAVPQICEKLLDLPEFKLPAKKRWSGQRFQKVERQIRVQVKNLVKEGKIWVARADIYRGRPQQFYLAVKTN